MLKRCNYHILYHILFQCIDTKYSHIDTSCIVIHQYIAAFLSRWWAWGYLLKLIMRHFEKQHTAMFKFHFVLNYKSLYCDTSEAIYRPISAVKKGEAKKVQVTEWPKDVISLWGQEEKLYQLGCVYRTLAYKINSFT